MEVSELLEENHRRELARQEQFDPLSGQHAPLEREETEIRDFYLPNQWLPQDMLKESPTREIIQAGSIEEYICKELHRPASSARMREVMHELVRERCRHDFCFWAYLFVRIKDKLSERDIPFRLNRPQRRLLLELERQRREGKPIRLILLKARQWGGSTLVQIYMAWIQLMHRRNWNSIIVAHIKDTSSEIKGMYSKLLENYPSWMAESDQPLGFSPFERSQNISVIPSRGCKVKIGTAEKPDSARGGDSALAHLTEVAFWRKTEGKSPQEIIRSVCAGMASAPYTLQVYESTANGTGNFFHREWVRAKKGESDKTALFVPWYEIEMYHKTVEDQEGFARRLLKGRESGEGRYEWFLWQKGASLENIAWYREKRKEYDRHGDMMAEFPSDDIEAFQHSGERVFDPYRLEEFRAGCHAPAFTGDIRGKGRKKGEALQELKFVSDGNGLLKIWMMPETTSPVSDRYVTVVDVGGRSAKADYSVVVVFDRLLMASGGVPEVVAQWRGHTDHDLLAWKAVQIAGFYNRALLVIESNTYETEQTEGDHTEYILDEIGRYYPYLYCRVPADQIRAGIPMRWGFHTNLSTKSMIIDRMVEVIRERLYIEREEEAINEARNYERKANGSYGAIEGCHDDILMTRMIGLYICYEQPLPKATSQTGSLQRKMVSEASF